MSREGDDVALEKVLRELGREARRGRALQLSEEAVDRASEEAWESYGEEAFGEEFQNRVAASLRDRAALRAPAVLVQSPRRWLLVAASFFLVAVMGAGILFWLRQGASEGPLPAYSLVALGMESERSGARPPEIQRPDGERLDVEPPDPRGRGVLEVVPGLRFSVSLRPSRRPDGEVTARIFAAPQQGLPMRWPEAESKVEVSRAGVVHLEVLGEEDWQRLEPGPWTLFFAVGRPGSLPTAAELRDFLESGSSPGNPDWRLLTQEILLVSAP